MSGYRPRPSPTPDIRPPTATRSTCGLVMLACFVVATVVVVWLVTHV